MSHRLTDEDGVDGPFDRAVTRAMREDQEALRKRRARAEFAHRFLRHAAALAVAGDAFRGEGRVVYEGGRFRVEFEVSPDDRHGQPQVARWLEENGPRWAWQTIRDERLVIAYREDREETPK